MSPYISLLSIHILPPLWTKKDDPKMHSHVTSGKGPLLVMYREFQALVNNHCMLKTPTMAKWVDILNQLIPTAVL